MEFIVVFFEVKSLISRSISGTVRPSRGILTDRPTDRTQSLSFLNSPIIRRMMCESMLSTNAEIAPTHCCLGEPACLVGIMLLFQTDWGTQHAGTAVVSVSILALLYKSCCVCF